MKPEDRQWIKGSWFTAKSYSSSMKAAHTTTFNNVSQGLKPTGSSISVLARLENIPLAYYDIPTLNGMNFSKRLWEDLRQQDYIKIPLESGALWGEAFHSDKDEVYIPNVTNRVTDFRIGPNNLVIGDLEILDTPYGLIAYTMALIGPVGNSSRGWGDLRPMGNNIQDVVPEEYFHVCWDLVTRPAVPDALRQIASSVNRTPQLKEAFSRLADERLIPAKYAGLRDMLVNPSKIFVMSSAEEIKRSFQTPVIVGGKDETSALVQDMSSTAEVASSISRKLASKAIKQSKVNRKLKKRQSK